MPLVTLALVLDALIGPVQEYCLRSFGTPKAALVGYAYMGGFAINLGVATVSGDLGGAYGFLLQAETVQGQLTPVVLVVLLATISFFGVSLIVSIVEEFGAVVANLAATARKGSGLAHAVMFHQCFSFGQWVPLERASAGHAAQDLPFHGWKRRLAIQH